MDNGLLVEKARKTDIPALAELRLMYLREGHGDLTDRDAEVISAGLPGYFDAHLGRDLFCYVLRDGGIIASCAFLLVVEKPMSPAFLNGRMGTVLNVYTRRESRRKGYAGSVMRALLADAKNMELSTVELKATAAGYPVYRAAGFRDDAAPCRPMEWKNDSLFDGRD